MEIHSLSLENYKHFQTFNGAFGQNDEELSKLSIKFLVGNNGSGKTSVLQAIGLIFTRAMNDESPGFVYELVYSIISGHKRVYVLLSNNSQRYPLTERLYIQMAESLEGIKNGPVVRERYSEQVNLHPRRIISFASGPNNSFEDVLVNSPLGAINSDIYDELKREGRNSGKLEYLQQLQRRLLYEPNCINLNGENAAFILAAIVLAEPVGVEMEGYRTKKNRLFQMVRNIRAELISFELDEVKCRQLEASPLNKMRYESLLVNFLQRGARRIKVVHSLDGTMPKAIRILTIPAGDILSSNPMEFLTMLVTAQRFGYLLNVNLFYKNEDSEHLLDHNSLSDGEFFWLSRMALIILSQQEYDENTLFLFDEPDVFLNENWTMQFISMLHDFAKMDLPGGESSEPRYNRQEYWIATHSTLILTDAFPDQTFKIESHSGVPGEFQAISLDIPTFGADRGEISALLFMDHERIGDFAKQVIDKALDEQKPYSNGRIQKMLDKVGPGYERFRLEEYLHARKQLRSD
ncbi:AAA family ATPase [Paenibacillus riograndensis]|uniref:Endonuclease GajA/Old nuclease/RecF-like AAA domain-containing protein n=1 Tax=Paenibacillus riograndensis SBR5 TaxID=1073571 RepID=A0A0E4HAV0_9BACL|nr:AAA family ATPase [Paenibacillus riograndensis]CQR52612.1 hypothetical protein PRIO_0912 [Paenibacillus riograndensis SBR5]